MSILETQLAENVVDEVIQNFFRPLVKNGGLNPPPIVVHSDSVKTTRGEK